jgi:8-oxo-dGTP pyrophosphatase MutT (NUDIX family)
MYKVFFNNKFVDLSTSLDNISAENPLFFIKYISADQIIKALKSKSVKGIVLYHLKKEKLLLHFSRLFPIVDAAGGLVGREDGSYLFIYRNGKWDLPKGKMEKNEKKENTAIREINEETGVNNLKIIKELSTTYHIYKASNQYKLKKTYWFLMKTNFSGKLIPQTEENIDEVKWVGIKKIPELISNAYKNIELIINENIKF